MQPPLLSWAGAVLGALDITMKVLLMLVLLCQLDLSLENPHNGTVDKNGKGIQKRYRNGVENRTPLDCRDIHLGGCHSDGDYVIYPAGPQSPVPVFCDMTTDGKIWTVFQRRFNGSLDFYRNWHNYTHGFGSAEGEYWLGLQNIHLLTLKRKYQLRIVLEDFEGNTAYADYKEFSLSPGAINAEEDGYSLHVAEFINGSAGDSLLAHSGEKFSTFDRDQDKHAQHCAEYAHGAFWYHEMGCSTANLNGRYLGAKVPAPLEIGFTWHSWKGPDYSLKGSEMKIRHA